MLKAETIHFDGENRERWDRFALAHPSGTIYHTSFWHEAIKKAYNHDPVYVVVTDDSENIRAGLPLFHVKSRITDSHLCGVPCAQYCNPLVDDDVQFGLILDHALKLKKICRARYIELRTDSAVEPFDGDTNRNTNTYWTFRLNLDKPVEDIHASFHKSCIQRAIKKALKSDLNLETATAEKHVKSFYDTYLKMRKSKGLLAQPYKFFAAMWDVLSREGLLRIYNAKLDDSVISSILLLKYKKTVIYEYGASLEETLNYRASQFLLWEAIKRAKEEGYKVFDFGRTSSDNRGLMQFKARWGAIPEKLTYHYLPKVDGFASVRQSGFAENLMHFMVKYLPDYSNRIIGALIYKHLV